MDETEATLSAEDYGRDLATVHALIKKHELLAADVQHHGDAAEQIGATEARFQRDGHFMRDEVHERAIDAIRRYHSLHEPTAIRRDNLDDSLAQQQFLRDADDELQWLADKEPLAASADLGASLTAVQMLQKKHAALEAELQAREPLHQALLQRAAQMLRAGHFASEQIDAQAQRLRERVAQLRDAAAIRRLRLLDAVESQMFYAETAECEQWMREKRPQLASGDCGRDEDSVQSLRKKLDALQRELRAFAEQVAKVQTLAEGLRARNHFDSANIGEKNEAVQVAYRELGALSERRDAALAAAQRLYEFLRQADEVSDWIDQQMTVTASEEYGEDVEHVEQLIAAFEAFVSNLAANEARVHAAVAKGEQLVASAAGGGDGAGDDDNEPAPYAEQIAKRVEDTRQLWDELKDLVNARQDALAGAKQVHVYDRRADETIAWIAEKQAALNADDFGQDMETIQALVRAHGVFDTELAPVKEQCEAVMAEARKLAELFPDARDHIEAKRDETIEAWSELRERTAGRKDRLAQAEQLQAYFDEYRDLMAWINETIARVTAPDLAADVAGAELLIASLKESRAEVATRAEAFERFYRDGARLIEDKHFLAHQVSGFFDKRS